MAVQLGSSGGVKSDINVTPLVDVMLVLLIIMMIVAPLLQQGVSVKLPVAANTTEKPDTQDQTVLAIDSNKRLYLNTVPVQAPDLRRRVEEVLEGKKDRIVIIKADAGTYGMGIMSVKDSSEVRDLNRRQRNKMAVVKEGLEVHDVLVQEGVHTFETVDGAVAEPVV